MSKILPKRIPLTKSVRLDQWLHAARFFKTRSLSAQAVKAGKVSVNGQRCKPANGVCVDDVLTIKRGAITMEIIVIELSTRRASATVANTWYKETPESKLERDRVREQLRLSAASLSRPPRKPDKKARRQIIRFRRDNSV